MNDTPELSKIIGIRLRKLRKQHKMTREYAGERLDVAPTTIQAHENGRNNVKPYMLIRYSKLYGVSIDFIVTGIPHIPLHEDETFAD